MKDEKNDFESITPFHQPEPVTQPRSGSDRASSRVLSDIFFWVSLISLGIAMISVAYVAIQVLYLGDKNLREHIFPVMVVIALSYVVGWIVALVGVRFYHSLVLPPAIGAYAWITLAGVSVLYIAIIDRLYQKNCDFLYFGKYAFIMGVGLAGLLGLHFLVEDHSLRLFSIPLMVIGLGHLCLMVYRYVFLSNPNYWCLSGDLVFFLGMATVSILMLMHVGVFSGVRDKINRLFDKEPKKDIELVE